MDLLVQYNINNNTDWNIKIDKTIKHQLMREYGLSVDNYVQRLIRTRKHENMRYYKYVPLTELLIKELEEYKDKRKEAEHDFHDCCDWLEYLFEQNQIDLIDFFVWNTCIKDMRYTKINTLVVQGPTNAGKSLIADSLIGICKPEEVSRERDNSEFHFDQLPEASCVIFEEPCITPVNVGTWKLLFEGKQIKTDIKHKDKEGVRRLPIWITTATKVTTNIDTYEACQINRLKIYQFLHSIQHRTDEYTKTYCQTNKTLKRAPGYVRAAHFAYLYLQNWKIIDKEIQKNDKQHNLNPDRLQYNTYQTTSNIIKKGTTQDAANAWYEILQNIWKQQQNDLQSNQELEQNQRNECKKIIKQTQECQEQEMIQTPMEMDMATTSHL